MGSVTNLKYHVVLTTKYRKPVLLGIEQSVYQAFRQVESVSDFTILDMNVEDGAHMYLAIKMSPRFSVDSMMNRVKGLTLHYLWQGEPDHLSKFYRVPKRKLWHGAHFCTTFGDVSKDTVLNYIRKQNGPREKRL